MIPTNVRMSDSLNIPFKEDEIHLMLELTGNLSSSMASMGVSSPELESLRSKFLKSYESLWNQKEFKTRRMPSMMMMEHGL